MYIIFKNGRFVTKDALVTFLEKFVVIVYVYSKNLFTK